MPSDTLAVPAAGLPGMVDPRAPNAARRRDAAFLALALGVMMLAFALHVVQGDRVAFWFQTTSTLPDLCLSRVLFDADCPGCGLTRSMISLAHGDFAAAWHYHRLGWLVGLLTLAQVPYRLYAIGSGKSISNRSGRYLAGGLMLALIANWLAGLIVG